MSPTPQSQAQRMLDALAGEASQAPIVKISSAQAGATRFFLGAFSPADLNPFELDAIGNIWAPREAALATSVL